MPTRVISILDLLVAMVFRTFMLTRYAVSDNGDVHIIRWMTADDACTT